ncbi:MAG: NYN domain-containing protein [Candidatus Pacebacteria bacterium]|nr:NYN domain-containing protein [Candidatus Paceibacterota bacterium]
MDIEELKKQVIKERLGINKEFGKIFSFIDFGNVNNWFSEDTQGLEKEKIAEDETISIDLKMLKDFADIFSEDTRFYYGHNHKKPSSLGFLYKSKEIFGKRRNFTKKIQWVHHHLKEEERDVNTRSIFNDKDGEYVLLPKCNFDVEIAVDTIKLLEKYDTCCLFSGDADFIYLNKFLKSQGKKIILIKGGHITKELRESVDKIINAQDIKKDIAFVKKQKPSES